MDTNWCLYCGHHTDTELPYCSRQCQARDNHALVDSDDDSHSQIIPILPVSHQSKPPSRYTGRDNDGISAWAAQIPTSASPTSPPPIQDSNTPFYSSSSDPSSSSLRPPKLLLPHRRALPPSLCMSTPKPTPPQCSVPIHTPQQPISDLLRDHPRIFGGESMTSLVTDSIATPTSAVVAPGRKPTSFLAQLATQVRSWVVSSSHSKSPLRPSEPAIVGIDDDSFPSKSRAYLPDDDLAAFAPTVAKLRWDLVAEQGSDSYDDEEFDDYQDSYSPVIPKFDLKLSPTTTPTPQPQAFPPPDSDSSSILDILVEEFHPAFKARGRQMVRCAS